MVPHSVHTISYSLVSHIITPGDIYVFVVVFFFAEQMCGEYCGSLDAVYIGTFDGDTCGCGNKEGYLLELKPEGTCDVVCLGSVGNTDTCGGSTSFDLLLINYMADTDDYFGEPYLIFFCLRSRWRRDPASLFAKHGFA